MSQFDNFHLWNNLSFQAWGILTSFKLTETEVLKRKEKVVWILDRFSWINLIDNGNKLILDTKEIQKHKTQRILGLLEENSILLDSLHYLSMDIREKWNNISDINEYVILLKTQLDNNNKVDYYSFVDINIWEIIHDLLNAFNDGFYSPTEEEISQLEILKKTRESFINFLNNPRWAVIFW